MNCASCKATAADHPLATASSAGPSTLCRLSSSTPQVDTRQLFLTLAPACPREQLCLPNLLLRRCALRPALLGGVVRALQSIHAPPTHTPAVCGGPESAVVIGTIAHSHCAGCRGPGELRGVLRRGPDRHSRHTRRSAGGCAPLNHLCLAAFAPRYPFPRVPTGTHAR